MTEDHDQVERAFNKITKPKPPLYAQVVSWVVAAAIVFAIVIGCIALARAVL